MLQILIKNRKLSYDFSISGKFLVIKGDSGTGKSKLWELVRSYNLEPDAVECLGYSKLQAIESINELDLVRHTEGTVFFIDEFSPIFRHPDRGSIFMDSENYFVIIRRSMKLNDLPIGLDDFVYLKDGKAFPVYPKQEHLTYAGRTLLCEDSGSGFEFLKEIVGNKAEVVCASGRDRFLKSIRKISSKSVTLVYDRAGISTAYEYLQAKLSIYEKDEKMRFSEIDWDSFEAYILESPAYGILVPSYPNKEIAAVKLFKQLFPGYQKSCLPDGMFMPVYWKVKDYLELLAVTQISPGISNHHPA